MTYLPWLTGSERYYDLIDELLLKGVCFSERPAYWEWIESHGGSIINIDRPRSEWKLAFRNEADATVFKLKFA